jgi:hypothetical protein
MNGCRSLGWVWTSASNVWNKVLTLDGDDVALASDAFPSSVPASPLVTCVTTFWSRQAWSAGRLRTT